MELILKVSKVISSQAHINHIEIRASRWILNKWQLLDMKQLLSKMFSSAALRPVNRK